MVARNLFEKIKGRVRSSLRGMMLQEGEVIATREQVYSRVVDDPRVAAIVDYLERQVSDLAFVGANNANMRKNGSDFPYFKNEGELAILREASRLCVRTNPHAEGLLSGLTAYTISSGATVTATPRKDVGDDAAGRAADVAKKAQFVIEQTEKRNKWGSRQQEFFHRCRRDGESYLRLFFQNDGETDIRFVWPEQIRKPIGTTDIDYGFGVKTDPDDAETVLEYAVYPIGQEGSPDPDLVPAEEMISLLINVDSGVRRGTPDFCFGVKDLLDAGLKLEKSMGVGSAIQASIAYIRQHTNATSSQIQGFVGSDPMTKTRLDAAGREKYIKDYEPGLVVDTNQNTAFLPSPYNAGIPGHIQVSQLMIRSACVKYNAPEWLGSADASNNNFASSLTVESPFYNKVKQIQKPIEMVFTDLFERVIRHAIDCGVLPADTFDLIAIEVKLPDPLSRNRLTEAQVAQIEIPLGLNSPQNYAASQGYDYKQITVDNEKHREETGGMGSVLPIPSDNGASES